ncbi:MAG TPA: amidohydrolase family protein [Candidatus Angelobacter sp.]
MTQFYKTNSSSHPDHTLIKRCFVLESSNFSGNRNSLIRSSALRLHRATTHANGDLAIDRILGVYEQIQKESPRKDPRFRIEHCTLLTDTLIRRMRALGVIPAPFSCYVYFHGDVMHFYGEERTQHMFPMRSFLNAGLTHHSRKM